MTQARAAAFDGLAQDYDAHFTATALGRTLRAMAWRHFERAFARCDYLLDIGCGTGEDAIHMASLGHRVLATDASPQMVRVASAKAERAGCAQRVKFLCLPMERLGAELAGERFDGAYSNFGAINCVADPGSLGRGLAPLLPALAPLALVVMGRYVPWEWAWYLARAQPASAFRRLRRGGVAWRGLTLSYPTPAELGRALAPSFVTRNFEPMGFALPGSYAAAWLERSPRVLAALDNFERLAQRGAVLSAFSDHYYFEALRQGA
jgi:SAM-dependent methyltransferase